MNTIKKQDKDLAIFYHGTDKELVYLEQDSYVTRNFKDASKFGYRKAVLSGREFVYIYMVELDMSVSSKFLKNDQNRDRAYITIVPINVELKCKYSTYQTSYKLRKFMKVERYEMRKI